MLTERQDAGASVAVFGPVGAAGSGVAVYAVDLTLNLAFALLAYVAWWLTRDRLPVLVVVMLALAALAVWQFLMLGVAIAGLFVRPKGLDRLVTNVSRGALLVAGAVLGLLLVNGIEVAGGLGLGLMAFVSQAFAGSLLSRGLPRIDRMHLALAQQNGVTAIILALQLETRYNRAVATIAEAILVTNVTHYLVNRLVDRSPRGPAVALSEPNLPKADDPPDG